MIAYRSAVTCAALHSFYFAFSIRFAISRFLFWLQSPVAAAKWKSCSTGCRGIHVDITIQCECKNRNLAFATDVASQFSVSSAAIQIAANCTRLFSDCKTPIAGCVHGHRSVAPAQTCRAAETADQRPVRRVVRRMKLDRCSFLRIGPPRDRAGNGTPGCRAGHRGTARRKARSSSAFARQLGIGSFAVIDHGGS